MRRSQYLGHISLNAVPIIHVGFERIGVAALFSTYPAIPIMDEILLNFQENLRDNFGKMLMVSLPTSRGIPRM